MRSLRAVAPLLLVLALVGTAGAGDERACKVGEWRLTKITGHRKAQDGVPVPCEPRIGYLYEWIDRIEGNLVYRKHQEVFPADDGSWASDREPTERRPADTRAGPWLHWTIGERAKTETLVVDGKKLRCEVKESQDAGGASSTDWYSPDVLLGRVKCIYRDKDGVSHEEELVEFGDMGGAAKPIVARSPERPAGRPAKDDGSPRSDAPGKDKGAPAKDAAPLVKVGEWRITKSSIHSIPGSGGARTQLEKPVVGYLLEWVDGVEGGNVRLKYQVLRPDLAAGLAPGERVIEPSQLRRSPARGAVLEELEVAGKKLSCEKRVETRADGSVETVWRSPSVLDLVKQTFEKDGVVSSEHEVVDWGSSGGKARPVVAAPEAK
ncbi:hypothetical protein HY251_13475 [bacterium]|nr:hypothetical protein [bacterium]